MKLLLVGRAGSRACDWSGYALLRDNVQHFVEGGEPSERFVALHGIEAAVDSGRCQVDAARLRGEVLRAWYALWRIPFEEAAVSIRTRAILTGSATSPGVRGTVKANRTGWRLPGNGANSDAVTEAARSFVAAVLSLTEKAVDGDTLEIRRAGAPPRFARRSADPLTARTGRPRLADRWLMAVGAAVLALACSAERLPPADAPSARDGQERSTELDRNRQPASDEPIVAPPPAYGNKVAEKEGP